MRCGRSCMRCGFNSGRDDFLLLRAEAEQFFFQTKHINKVILCFPVIYLLAAQLQENNCVIQARLASFQDLNFRYFLKNHAVFFVRCPLLRLAGSSVGVDNASRLVMKEVECSAKDRVASGFARIFRSNFGGQCYLTNSPFVSTSQEN